MKLHYHLVPEKSGGIVPLLNPKKVIKIILSQTAKTVW